MKEPKENCAWVCVHPHTLVGLASSSAESCCSLLRRRGECCPESSLTWAQELGPCHWPSLGSVNQGKDAFILFSYKQSKLIGLPRALEARLWLVALPSPSLHTWYLERSWVSCCRELIKGIIMWGLHAILICHALPQISFLYVTCYLQIFVFGFLSLVPLKWEGRKNVWGIDIE